MSQFGINSNVLMVHSTPASRSLINTLKKTAPRTEPWGTPLVTGCQPEVATFTRTLWTLPFSQIFTQHTMKPLIPQLPLAAPDPGSSLAVPETGDDPVTSTQLCPPCGAAPLGEATACDRVTLSPWLPIPWEQPALAESESRRLCYNNIFIFSWCIRNVFRLCYS